jgi:hypothetical protein
VEVARPARITPSVAIVRIVTGTSPTRHSQSTTLIEAGRSSFGTGGPSDGLKWQRMSV